MQIKELIDLKKKKEELLDNKSTIQKKVDELSNKLKNPNISTEELNIIFNKLCKLKDNISSINKQIDDILSNNVCKYYRATFNRKDIGTILANLMSNILNDEYVYQEDYIYEIDDGSKLRDEFRHINILKKRVFTLVKKELANHEPYMEYYDQEEYALNENGYKDYYSQKQIGYHNPFNEKINNNELIVLPNEYIESYYSEEDKDNYKEGNMNLEIYLYDSSYPNNQNESSIKNYNKHTKGYNKIIADFLLTVFIKEKYINRKLTINEIDSIKDKFIELYNNGYSFEYFENDLYQLNNKTYKRIK